MSALEAVRSGAIKLLPQRALWAPAAKALFVADLHLGKAAAFRALGSPAPTGVSEETLRRLAQLIEATGPEHVVALGDFTHARASLTPGLLASLRGWRARWSGIAFTIVLGNHDRSAGRSYADSGFDWAEAPAWIAGMECRHHPVEADQFSEPIALAGHIHPVARLNGPGRDSLRVSCFVVVGRQIILPAFGEFTGGSLVSPREGERLFIATRDGVFEIGRRRDAAIDL